MPDVQVALLPSMIDASLSGRIGVMIDVLRASTTITHALVNGAKEIIPCQSVEQALDIKSKSENVLLGGERQGQLIEGFDLDNSPLKYTPEVVGDRTVVFTTTNGTKALDAMREADEVLIGAFVNRAAIIDRLISTHKSVCIVCAGTDGVMTAEDILFAGAVAHELVHLAGFEMHDMGTELAIAYHQAHPLFSPEFREAFLNSQGARNLTNLGLNADIERSMQFDLFNAVPTWDAESNQILI